MRRFGEFPVGVFGHSPGLGGMPGDVMLFPGMPVPDPFFPVMFCSVYNFMHRLMHRLFGGAHMNGRFVCRCAGYRKKGNRKKNNYPTSNLPHGHSLMKYICPNQMHLINFMEIGNRMNDLA